MTKSLSALPKYLLILSKIDYFEADRLSFEFGLLIIDTDTSYINHVGNESHNKICFLSVPSLMSPIKSKGKSFLTQDSNYNKEKFMTG